MNDFDGLLAQVRETSIHRATTTETYAELYRQLLCDSLQHNASHIHLHCSPTELVIRYRVLDKLRLRAILPVEASDGLYKAIKQQFHLDQFERRRTQDGRTVYQAEGGKRSIRVSIIYALHGPAGVLAWEKHDQKCLQLHELGLLADQEALFNQMLRHRRGFLVVSGYGRAGRRTLGHAALLAAKSDGREVLSLEWGPSRPLPGILQCDVSGPSGVSQLDWILAALRRRPDAVFIEYAGNQDTIGELIAAARGSCLVVVSMERGFEHLIDYLRCKAIPRSVSTQAVLGGVGQRLIPRVCSNCTTIYTPKDSELRQLRIRCEAPSRLSFARGTGCSECRGTGRSGFVGVHEVAVMNDDLRTMFLQKSPPEAIRQHLLDRGMTTYYESTIQKLVAREIASTAAVAYCQHLWRELKGWITVDPDSGLARRTDRSDLEH